MRMSRMNVLIVILNFDYMKKKFIDIPDEAIIRPDDKFNPIQIKYSHVCRTKEERDLFVDFIAAMKKLKESPNPIAEEKVSEGVKLISDERQRQIEVEGWSKEHDSQHEHGEIAIAASLYAMPSEKRMFRPSTGLPVHWPWYAKWWKPSPENRLRELVKAGALIAAEIDRLTTSQQK